MIIKPPRKPEMTPREARVGSTWYVLVTWGDWPSQQVGGFRSQAEAQAWIDHQSVGWLSSRYEEPPFV